MKTSKVAAIIVSFLLSVSVIAGSGITSFTATPLLKVEPNLSTDYPSGYNPSQIRTAYGLDKITNTGKGQKIAIVDAYGNKDMFGDYIAFSNYYNLPQTSFTIKDMGVTTSDSGWALETALDVEWAHALAPDASLLLVEAKSSGIDDLVDAIDYAVNNGATAVSMSWGCPEYSVLENYASHFVHSGTLFLASSGDNGAGSQWPSDSSNVISVGGTTLNLDSNGNRTSETAWGGSGGGVSSIESEPTWQQTFGITASKRSAPDISLDADPNTGVSVYCTVAQSGGLSGWFKVGGTSLSAPACAGIISSLNQNSTVIKNTASFYNLAGTTSYKNTYSAFYDITSGSNGNSAVTGYDTATGLGSLEADKILAAQ